MYGKDASADARSKDPKCLTSVIYRKRWSSHYKEFPQDEITEKRAREYFNKRKPFTVVIENGDDLRVLVFSFTGNFCAQVFFLDEYLRTHVSYSFRELSDKKLFINRMGEYYYPEEGTMVARLGGQSMYFEEDGRMKIFEGLDHNILCKEGLCPTSVLVDHYEPMPEFGKWNSILRYERSLPAEQDTRKPGELQICRFPNLPRACHQ